jgi:hypothetical protein
MMKNLDSYSMLVAYFSSFCFSFFFLMILAAYAVAFVEVEEDN